jgi:PAS domain S-box-containing protein
MAGHKQIAAALYESEACLRAIIDHAPANISLKDSEARYVLVNRRHMEQYGTTNDRIRGKRTHEVFEPEYAEVIEDLDRMVLESKRAVNAEYEWPAEGGVQTFYIVKFPIPNGAGGLAGIGSISTDITEQKRVEEELRLARDTLEERILERTADLENENAERRRAEEALRDSERVLRAQVVDLEEAQRKLERQGMDLVRFADDLRVAHDRAEAANRAKSEFLANTSHELRTPLNAIIGFSEIIKDEIAGPVGNLKYLDYAADINDSGRHLLDLINDILDLSKIESGTQQLYENDVRIAEVLASILPLVEGRAQTGAVELVFDVEEYLPALRADHRKLKQILVNLLANAIKFTPEGGRVTLKAWCRGDSGHVFQVIDTGIGMRLEDIPRALAPFQQIDSNLNRKFEGTGLGLPLTKALAELHGGTLDLQSQLGCGTTATVRFPAERIVHSRHETQTLGATDRQAS